MKQNILTHSLCVLLGLVAGFLVAIQVSSSEPTERSYDKKETTHQHHHESVEITNAPVPTIAVVAYKDTKDGYNLVVQTTNFTFTPEAIDGVPVDRQGHGHLYVNGKKIARLYSGWYHLSDAELEPGENRVTVTLNADNHSEWMVQGEVLKDTTTIFK